MSDKKKYQVVAALVSVPSSDGRVHYFYAGAELPDGLDQDTLDRLVEDGYVAKSGDEVTPVLGSSPPELVAHETVPSNPVLPSARKRA